MSKLAWLGEIPAVTLTNEAAREIQDRVTQLTSSPAHRNRCGWARSTPSTRASSMTNARVQRIGRIGRPTRYGN